MIDGVPASEAVTFVRKHYDPRAVETPWQRRYVARFNALWRPRRKPFPSDTVSVRSAGGRTGRRSLAPDVRFAGAAGKLAILWRLLLVR